MNNTSIYKKILLAYKYPLTAANLLFDYVFNRKITPFPRLIKFYVTNVCNLNCPMCVNAKFRMKNIKASNLTLKSVKQVLPEIIKYKPFIYLVGGEPLLNEEILKIITAFSKNKILTSMTSNGYLLEKQAKKIARSGLCFLSLSLDSNVAKEHDVGRGVVGSYNHLIRGLKVLNKERIITGFPLNIKINTVIRKDNYYKLSEIYDFVEELGVDEWSLQHYIYKTPKVNRAINKYYKTTGIGEDNWGDSIAGNNYFDEKEIKILSKQIEMIKNKSRSYKTKLSIKPKINNLKLYYQGVFPSKKSSCKTPFNSIAIYNNGKITTGCLSWKIGDLKTKESLKKIWNNEKTKKFQKLILKNKVIPPCFRCCSLNFIFD
ncbi:radical SAM/SPASM domain-containing protein [Patescibacteria group bacterium]